jgi:hypothetical protein
LINIELLPASEEVIVGATGALDALGVIDSSGVDGILAEGDSPKEVIAEIVKVYNVEFKRPVIFEKVSLTIIGSSSSWRGGVIVMEYPVIAKSSDSGAVHIRFTKAFPGYACKSDTAPGRFTGGGKEISYKVSLLIELFAKSRTYRFPDGSIVIPPGDENPAVSLLPSEGVEFSSEPANVVVSPVFVILRIV